MYNIIARNGVVDIRFLNAISPSQETQITILRWACSLQRLFVRFPFKKQRTFFIIICGMLRMVRIYKKRGSYTSYLYKY